MASVRQTRKKIRPSKLRNIPGVSQCAPRMKSRNTRSCLTEGERKKVIGAYRKAYGQRGAKLPINNELVLVEKAPLPAAEKQAIEEAAFRPKMPKSWHKDPDEWLSDYDITQVMKKYEAAYPDFHFMEVVPIDFSAPDPYANDGKTCISKTFCHIDLADFKKKGITKIGGIFNLDTHDKGGSHWVAFFVDLGKKEINYFDSYGVKPPVQIARLMRSLTLQDPSLKLQSNGRRFQYGNSECGMYSMYFIISMLNGVSFKKFVKNPISDSEMLELRQFLFRP